MAWKQDLAKLKQEIKAAGDPAPAKAPPPKAEPLPNKPMEDEDALFLAAMGGRAATPVVAPGQQEPRPQPVVRETVDASGDFLDAMSGMKGMKPISSDAGPTGPSMAPEASPGAGLPQAAPLPPPAPTEEASPAPGEALPRMAPVLIHLAAGMAIEVDGVLDLRGHTFGDARERLKERIQDGLFLGWRTLHVILGPSEPLRQGFLAFLAGTHAAPIARYAQAPVPMGGAHAWILYYRGAAAASPVPPRTELP